MSGVKGLTQQEGRDDKQALKVVAYDRLRSLILGGELAPGEFLTERTLSTLLQMSRTPIRSAIERLHLEGLINYAPNRGLVVAELSISRAVDVYDLRLALEPYVIRRLAERRWSQEDIDKVQHNLEKQRMAAEHSDVLGFVSLDSQFHQDLIGIYGNVEMIQIMDNIQDKLFLMASRVMRKDSNRMRTSLADHEEILSRVLNNDASKAVAKMEEHLEYGKTTLIR